MDTNKILVELDAEIAQLTKIRLQILATSDTPQRGRPMGSAKRATSKVAKSAAPKKRAMSEEARAKIAAAQKARWAKQKKAAKKVA